MPNLQAMIFNGSFQRNADAVAADLRRYEADPNSFSTEVLERIKRDQTPHDFKVEILYYDSKTGLFIAKGSDDAGNSGIYGKVLDDHIIFSKGYPRDGFRLSESGTMLNQLFRRFDYIGTIQKFSSPLFCRGTYSMPGHGKHMNGTWELTQVKE